MFVAVAGRRIDALDAKEARFPLARADDVRERVREFFSARGVKGVVGSAANGSDLIALSAAGELGLRRRVVLPFPRERFRETSVVDRPGDWGGEYDRVLAQVEKAGDLVLVPPDAAHPSNDARYAAANRVILEQVLRLAKEAGDSAAVLLIWDGKSRGSGDLTDALGAAARSEGLAVFELPTL